MVYAKKHTLCNCLTIYVVVGCCCFNLWSQTKLLLWKFVWNLRLQSVSCLPARLLSKGKKGY